MMAAARILSRRSIAAIVVMGVFFGAMLIASRRLTEICPEGGYCYGLARLQDNLPSFRIQKETGYKKPSGRPSGPSHRKPPSTCAGFPDTSNMLLVMKTGASETFARIPTQVLTNLRCLPEYFIFSDMKQNVAGFHIRDSLDTVLEEVKTGNKDFELYYRQQKCPVHKEECNKHFDAAAEGWSLDKYKNIHIAEKTYKMRPNYDWYVFVDADTYVVWPTLVEWMKRLDPTDRHYLGSVTYVSDFPFGHGGSGYIVSKAAMQEFFDGKEGVANRWDHRASQECCGDYMFGLALKTETGIAVNNTWPTINGEKPNTIWYGEGQWCHPMATMHHIGSEEISMFEEFEKDRRFLGPLLVKDVYHRFVEPHLNEYHQDWDNMSDDTWYMDTTPGKHEDSEIEKAKKEDLSEHEKKAHLSVEDCRVACQHVDDCMQWRFYKGICGTSRAIKHGYPTKGSDNKDERRISGWNIERINAWVQKHDNCAEIPWPVVGPEAKKLRA